MEHNYGGDRERAVKKGIAWEKFKDFLSNRDPDIDVSKILTKTKIRRDPVISYGIIEFVKIGNRIMYHVFRKRNTMEYDILIRGFAQKNQLFDMLCLLSEDERHKILNHTWEEIWSDYWIDHNSHGYTALKSQSQRRFGEIRELLALIVNDVDFGIKDRPYIFPKGRPMKNETGLDAAKREAQEETGCNFDSGYLYFNTPIIQQYIGSDGMPYMDYYYVWNRSTIYASPTISLPIVPKESRASKASERRSEDRWNNLFKKIDAGANVEEVENLITEINSPRSDMKSPSRLRSRTISHELESDAWLELPIFTTTREQLEWQNSVDAYEEFGLFKRHFSAILEIHSHLV